MLIKIPPVTPSINNCRLIKVEYSVKVKNKLHILIIRSNRPYLFTVGLSNHSWVMQSVRFSAYCGWHHTPSQSATRPTSAVTNSRLRSRPRLPRCGDFADIFADRCSAPVVCGMHWRRHSGRFGRSRRRFGFVIALWTNYICASLQICHWVSVSGTSGIFGIWSLSLSRIKSLNTIFKIDGNYLEGKVLPPRSNTY